ncbi:N-acetylmuramoyl-L-alanine amidase [Canibacter zhoujuaniae]|uniref:N-acetylmuramoyl-L-alanine amidase n=1 Tax=Canibacter zhoujuaniae TaxID=2708343 RepID=UPI0014204B7D|nr:N-acetylmuramoyl-L-alanine amidase [Canibacter zhoujuaniae]
MVISKHAAGTVPHHNKINYRGAAKIQYVIVHHWAGTHGGDSRLLNPHEQVSANYIVYSDGRIIQQVPEEYRAWTSGHSIDFQAITIETQNSATGGVWPVTDAAQRALEKLIGDIGARYWAGRVERWRVRGHREFAATACPGEFLWARLGAIADAANKLAGGTPLPKPKPVHKLTLQQVAQQVIRGNWGNGADRVSRLRTAGYDPAKVQAEVNRQLGTGTAPKPDIAKIAREVIAGKYGNGEERRRRLGGLYPLVQAEVNRQLGLR